MAEQLPTEPLQGFDCLMICLQLALSWDDKKVKKLLKKHGLDQENPRADFSLALYQLHHEFHAESSPVARDLIDYFNRIYRKEIAQIAALECDPHSPALLQPTIEMLKTNPGGTFWALATDPRIDVHSLSTYHAHRMLLEAFHGTDGVVWRFDRLKEQHKELKQAQREAAEECAQLKAELGKLQRENASLKQQLTDFEQNQRELRMLRHELGKARPISGKPQTSRPSALPDNTLLIEKDPVCPFRNQECCERAQTGRCTLENLKVALVGGIERLENQYRSTFESLGAAKFYFHSGHCDGAGAERLRNTTEAADIVVFVTRVNSHNALNVLKGVCKKSGKSFLAVRETSPEQISRLVLDEVNKQTPGN